MIMSNTIKTIITDNTPNIAAIMCNGISNHRLISDGTLVGVVVMGTGIIIGINRILDTSLLDLVIGF